MSGIIKSSSELLVASAVYPDVVALPAAVGLDKRVGEVAKRKMLGPIQGQAPKIARVVPPLEELCRKLDWEPFTFEATKVKEVAISVKEGNKNALLSLAYHYLKQARELVNVELNYQYAKGLFEKPELKDHPYALYALGEMAENGEGELGEVKNYGRALAFYEESAALGLFDANVKCYSGYKSGVVFPSNYQKALFYSKAAANFGHTGALKGYALFLIKGINGFPEPNYKLAYPILKSLADGGDAESAKYVALMNYSGQGVEKSFHNAGVYYKIAIEDGHFSCFYDFVKLAQEGDMAAMCIVGTFYENGIAILREKDMTKAFNAYSTAANYGAIPEAFAKVKELDLLIKEESKNIVDALINFHAPGKPFIEFADTVKMLEDQLLTTNRAQFYLKQVKECGPIHFNTYAGQLYFLKSIQKQLKLEHRYLADPLLTKYNEMREISDTPYRQAEDKRSSDPPVSFVKLKKMYQHAISCGSDKAIIRLVHLYIDKLSDKSFEMPIRRLIDLVNRYYPEEARNAGCLFFDTNTSHIVKAYQRMYHHLLTNPKTKGISKDLFKQMAKGKINQENSDIKRKAILADYCQLGTYDNDGQAEYIRRVYEFATLSDEESIKTLLKVFERFPGLKFHERVQDVIRNLNSKVFEINLTFQFP